jgi:hypothetical protein
LRCKTRLDWSPKERVTHNKSYFDSSRTCEYLPLNATGSLSQRRRAPTSTATDLTSPASAAVAAAPDPTTPPRS